MPTPKPTLATRSFRAPGPGRRPAFTMIELIVVLAVILILAATITPSVIRRLDRARIESAASELQAIAEALHAFDDDLGETTGPPSNRVEYPATLLQLVVSDELDANICGQNYDGTDQAQWSGPYLTRNVPATGLPTAIGTIEPVLGFIDDGGNDQLLVDILDVTQEDALLLNSLVDADGGDGDGGSVQWSAGSMAGLVTLHYTVPVGSAC